MGVCFVTGRVPMSLQLDVFVEFAINKVIYCKIFIKIFKFKIFLCVVTCCVVVYVVVMFLLLLCCCCFILLCYCFCCCGVC